MVADNAATLSSKEVTEFCFNHGIALEHASTVTHKVMVKRNQANKTL